MGDLEATGSPPGANRPGDADQRNAGPREFQQNKTHPSIFNGDNSQQQRAEDVQRQIPRVQLTPGAGLNEAIGHEHHQSSDHRYDLHRHRMLAHFLPDAA